MTKKQRATTPGAGRRILTPPPCRWSIPPTTEEWGEGKGEGLPISRANSMEGAPLPGPLPARASQGEGAGGFRDGGGIQVRPLQWVAPILFCQHPIQATNLSPTLAFNIGWSM